MLRPVLSAKDEERIERRCIANLALLTLETTLLNTLKLAGPQRTAQLVVRTFRMSGHPKEIRRHL